MGESMKGLWRVCNDYGDADLEVPCDNLEEAMKRYSEILLRGGEYPDNDQVTVVAPDGTRTRIEFWVEQSPSFHYGVMK